MMRRAGWVRGLTQLAPLLVSSVVWLWVLVLAPSGFLAGVACAIAAVLLRRTPAVMAWRHGVRLADGAETPAVRAGFIADRALRGRGQPREWVFRRPVADQVIALTTRDVSVSESLLGGDAARRSGRRGGLGGRRVRDGGGNGPLGEQAGAWSSWCACLGTSWRASWSEPRKPGCRSPGCFGRPGRCSSRWRWCSRFKRAARGSRWPWPRSACSPTSTRGLAAAGH